MKQVKIVFITTTNLSTNPRLLKEIHLAQQKGCDCHLIAFRLGNWSDKTEAEHLKQVNCQYHSLFASKKPLLPWFISTFIWKSCNLLNVFLRKNLRINAFAHNKRTWIIKQQLKKLKPNFSLVIAHNLGALYAAFNFAQQHRLPFAFDIEDYHPGEKCSSAEKKRREFLLKKLLPKAAYFTYASPLIGKYSLKLLPDNQDYEHFLVNNSFNESDFYYGNEHSEKIKLVWFSQNIAPGRGLELIVPALAKFKDKIQLTLIGNLYSDFNQSFLKPYLNFIDFCPPTTQKELHQKLGEFDVGLAIELSAADFNRDICLTNKIFAYAQSGLYVLATDTSAQKMFMEEHKILGITTPQTTETMEKSISQLIDNIELIRTNKKERFEYAKRLAWEQEGEKLMNIWEKVIT